MKHDPVEQYQKTVEERWSQFDEQYRKKNLQLWIAFLLTVGGILGIHWLF